MSYKVYPTSSFQTSVKRLKRFRNVNNDIATAIKELLVQPESGSIIPNDYDVRKLRAKNSDLKKGKSAGYRLLYYIDEPNQVIYLLLLYAKSDKTDVSLPELKELVEQMRPI
jgi:mRNA-degrading endonuclease RelE of RelBE toxin-antitoxin system